MPKDIESLEESKEIRENVIRKYGEVLTSVWEIDYSWGMHVIEYDKRKQQKVAEKKHDLMDYDKRLSKSFSMSSQNVRGKQGGLSTFPPALAHRITMFYSEEGETILDPMAGHNSRMQIVNESNRHYIGYDVSKDFIAFNKLVRDEILGVGKQNLLFENKYTITLHEQSSQKMNEANNSIDLVFTSPPYWDIEFYGEEPEQLGYHKTYEQFLLGIKDVLAESYRVLKTNRYCAFNINDFRKNGTFYDYHADIMRLMKEVGFSLHDCIIIKWKSAIGACFASQIESRKICAKSHEYLIVGKKP